MDSRGRIPRELIMANFPYDDKQHQKYLAWTLANKVPISNDYNMEGFFNASQNPLSGLSSSINPNDNQMHYPDAYKLPNHQSFSTDSNYYNPKTMPQTPSWQGGEIGGTNGQESWSLRRPNGDIVVNEAPWLKNKGLLGQ